MFLMVPCFLVLQIKICFLFYDGKICYPGQHKTWFKSCYQRERMFCVKIRAKEHILRREEVGGETLINGMVGDGSNYMTIEFAKDRADSRW